MQFFKFNVYIFVLFMKYYQDDEIKVDEMGGARSTHGRNERFVKKNSSEILKRTFWRHRRR
jgi:hypothetical protein